MNSKLVPMLIPTLQMDSSRTMFKVKRYQSKLLTSYDLHYAPHAWSPVSSLYATSAAENNMTLSSSPTSPQYLEMWER